jgi:hypothetical protein
MILDAHALHTWQSCRRRYELETEWRPLRWRASVLFATLLRRAIYALSNAGDWEALASDAKSQFLSTAANPGLDLPQGTNPYTVAKSWCGMFDTLLATLARTTLLTVKELPPVWLNASVSWQPRAWADESGQLHRWLTVDAWDEDALNRELHSWRTIGDIAATRQGMMLHVIETGRATKEGRTCPWSRAWKHPGIRTLTSYRFRKPTGGALTGWLAYHYDDRRDDAGEWADKLIAEGEFARATHHLLVQSPTERQCAQVLRDVLVEALEIARNEGSAWHEIPMARGACDAWVPCPFAYVCYAADQIIDPAILGLYQRRQQDTLVATGGSK